MLRAIIELREALCNSGLVIEVDMKVLIGGHDDDANGSDEKNLQSVAPALASVIVTTNQDFHVNFNDQPTVAKRLAQFAVSTACFIKSAV